MSKPAENHRVSLSKPPTFAFISKRLVLATDVHLSSAYSRSQHYPPHYVVASNARDGFHLRIHVLFVVYTSEDASPPVEREERRHVGLGLGRKIGPVLLRSPFRPR